MRLFRANWQRARIDHQGTAEFYRAMCLYQLDQKVEARNLFKKTQERTKALLKDQTGNLTGDSEPDYIILRLARQEAGQLTKD